MKLSAYIRKTTLFRDQVQESLTRLGKEFGYNYQTDDVWDGVEIIWKPIVLSIYCYIKVPSLRVMNNFLTSPQTLTRKDSLLKTGLRVMGNDFFQLHPPTTLAPDFPTGNQGWIIKPSGGYGGRDIEICWSSKELSRVLTNKKEPMIIQKYIDRPLLFKERKFDVRVHILLMSDRVLYHEQIYIRVAPDKYILGNKSNKIHLTNITLHGEEGNLHPLEETNISMELLVNFIRRLKPLFLAAQEIERIERDIQRVHFDTFDLLGLDIMFDEDMTPWLLEINKDPAFKSEGFRAQMGRQLIDDTLKEAIFFKWHPERRKPDTQFHEF